MDGWRKKRTIMRRYDAGASIYDARYVIEQTAKINAALKHLKWESRGLLLDVGCGTGILFKHVADNVDEIIGIDFSGKTLLQAKDRLRLENLENVHLVRADADNMPFSDNAFGRIFALTILQNSPNPNETLNEIRRVSKNHTIFVITGLKKIFNGRLFRQLLRNAGLKVVGLEKNSLECCVAVCTRLPIEKRLSSEKKNQN